MLIYPAIFIPEDVGYSVTFPGLDGCHTQGESLADAMTMAQEALGLYAIALEEDGFTLPEPRSIQDIQVSDKEFVSYVAVDSTVYRRKTKAVKKTLTIPEWLNEAAEKQHVNFSSVLQDALVKKLNV